MDKVSCRKLNLEIYFNDNSLKYNFISYNSDPLGDAPDSNFFDFGSGIPDLDLYRGILGGLIWSRGSKVNKGPLPSPVPLMSL